MPSGTTVVLKRIEVGRLLRELRGRTTLSGADLGEAMGADRYRVNKIETGKVWPDDDELGVYFEMCPVDALEKAEIVSLITLGKQDKKGWWEEFTGRVQKEILRHVIHEQGATSIVVFAPLTLPAHVQFRGYAEAITEYNSYYFNKKLISDLVTLRLRRACLLEEDFEVTFTLYLGEAILMIPVGGNEVLHEQLGHLLLLMDHPRVDLRIVPFSCGAYASYGAPVHITTSVGKFGETSVYSETQMGGLQSSDRDDYERAMRLIQPVMDGALSKEETATAIKKRMEQLVS